MKTSTALEERKSAARGLNIVAAAGVILVLATAATALTFAATNPETASTVPLQVEQPA